MTKDNINYSELGRQGVAAAVEAASIVDKAADRLKELGDELPPNQIASAKAVALGTVAAKAVERLLPKALPRT
jgi:hypothetical protein